MKKVVITEPIHPDGRKLLAQRDDVDIEELPDTAPDTLRDALRDANAVLVRSARLTESVLAPAKELEVVSRHGVGCDNVAVDHLSARRIPVAIAADANSTSVAEHVIMMMLVLNKQIFAYDSATREGRFAERGRYRTSELDGKTMLIVGFGRIGRKLAPLCRAFGMRVIVTDIALDSALAAAMGCESAVDFHPHLHEADYLSVHVPLTADTNPLIGVRELSTLAPRCFVFNCARGGVVDEHALAGAAREGRIAGFGADVFGVEPPLADNPLLTVPNSVLAPHSAAVTAEGSRRMAVSAAQNILDCFDARLRNGQVFNGPALGLP